MICMRLFGCRRLWRSEVLWLIWCVKEVLAIAVHQFFHLYKEDFIVMQWCGLTLHGSYHTSPVLSAHYPHEWELSEHGYACSAMPLLCPPPMVNSESAVVWLLPFHTWLHKTCGRLLPGRCPCLCIHAWLCDEILKCSIIGHWVAADAISVPYFYFSFRLYLGGVALFSLARRADQEGKPHLDPWQN